MATTTANIKVEVDDSQLKNLNKTLESTSKAAEDATGASDTLGDSTAQTGNKTNGMVAAFRSAGPAIAAVGTALAVSAGAALAAGRAYANLITEVAQLADEQIKTARSLGLTVEEFGELEYAMGLSGTSIQEQRGAFAQLSQKINENSEALTELGISTRNTDGSLRSATEVLGDIADRFSGMEDGARKTAEAVKIFGETGISMISMLNAGSEGIEQMRSEAVALGLVFDEQTAVSAEAFNDGISRITSTFQGLKNEIVTGAIPILNRALPEVQASLSRLLGVIEENEELFSELAETIGDTTVDAIELFVDSIETAANVIRKTNDVIESFNEFLGPLDVLIGDVNSVLDIFISSLGLLLEAVSKVLLPFTNLYFMIRDIVDIGSNIRRSLSNDIVAPMEDIEQATDDASDSMAEFATNAQTGLSGVTTHAFELYDQVSSLFGLFNRKMTISPSLGGIESLRLEDINTDVTRFLESAHEFRAAISSSALDLGTATAEVIDEYLKFATQIEFLSTSVRGSGFVDERELNSLSQITKIVRETRSGIIELESSLRSGRAQMEENSIAILRSMYSMEALTEEARLLDDQLLEGIINQEQYDQSMERLNLTLEFQSNQVQSLAESNIELDNVTRDLHSRMVDMVSGAEDQISALENLLNTIKLTGKAAEEFGQTRLNFDFGDEGQIQERLIRNKAAWLEFRDAITDSQDTFVESGIQNLYDQVQTLDDMASNLPNDAFIAFGENLASVFSGDGFDGKGLKEKMGQLIGGLLKQMGAAAIAMGTIALVPPPYNPNGNPVMGAALIAGGVAAVALGSALAGGGGGKGASGGKGGASASNTGGTSRAAAAEAQTTVINLNNNFSSRFDAREIDRAMAESLERAQMGGQI